MYREFKPHTLLATYIDAYWCSQTGPDEPLSYTRILPDTCTDIIICLGGDIHAAGDDARLTAGNCYLQGNMSRYADVGMEARGLVYGIRFRPFALRSLLGFAMGGTADKSIELGRADFDFKNILFPKKHKTVVAALDAFFINKLQGAVPVPRSLLQSIHRAKGGITVAELAARHHTTERQLERIFRDHGGMTVKELCKQTRLLHTIKDIRERGSRDNLLGIALDNGYYDHAHLCKDLKKYTGYVPGDLLR